MTEDDRLHEISEALGKHIKTIDEALPHVRAGLDEMAAIIHHFPEDSRERKQYEALEKFYRLVKERIG